MLAFFRRVLSSWLAVGLLALIMIAFIITGVGTPGGGLAGGGGPGDDAVATVGGRPVLVTDIQQRVDRAVREARQQQPTLTTGQFLAAIGGLGPIVEQYIGATVLTEWARKHGISASERLIGGEIASNPAFRGTTGQFDQNRMNAVLAENRLSVAQLHDSTRDSLMQRQLIAPILMATRAPEGLLRSYAELLVAPHQGMIGMVQAKTDGIPTPSDQEVAAFYKANVARYSLPERRVLRYALISADTVSAPTPTDAEIAAQYKTDAAKYAASETRTIQRVVLPDENAATAFAAKVAKGTSFDQAAKEAGLAAADITVGAVTHDAFAGTDGKPLADAAFALKAGGTTAPIKSALGWSIAHVGAVTRNPARSLDQVRSEIGAALAKKKKDDALAQTVQQVEDAVNGGASFNEVVAKNKLQVITTPPLLPNGAAPTDPNYKPDANVPVLLKAAADATPDDEPTVETIDPAHFALLSVASVVPAAPRPLAEIKANVAQDMVAQQAAQRAHGQAQALLAKINGGQPIAAAFADAKIEAPKPIALTSLDLSRAGANAPAPIRALFRLPPGKADLIAGPNGSWFVVKLEAIAPPDPKMLPMVVGMTRGELQRSLGEEYAQQFANAARNEIKVKRNPAAVSRLEQQLRGGGQ
jgi:peptidyl-prolyl cis-trans isomerase D